MASNWSHTANFPHETASYKVVRAVLQKQILLGKRQVYCVFLPEYLQVVPTMSRMRTGKVPPKILEEYVFSYLGASDPAVIYGPGIGRDAALIQIGRQVTVATTDPITGVVEHIGAYAIKICANDVATFGIRPRWFLATILLPEDAKSELLRTIMQSMHNAAKDLQIAIVGGHSEITTGLTRPIVVGFMLGVAEKGRYVTSADAKPGNVLILTKGVGIEGTAILASERKDDLSLHLPSSLIKRAQMFVNKISVVDDGLKAMATGAVTAMHDPTEGGVANGLHEMADASKLGFIINRKALKIHDETHQICNLLGLDPLNLISSGAMIIAAKSSKVNEVLRALQESGIQSSIIGKLVEDPAIRLIIEPDGSKTPLQQPTEDALWDALIKPL
jgi:hydrogenase expression/formation protein HypE